MKLSDRSSTAGALSKKAYTDTKAKKPTTMPLNHVKILMSTSLARAGE